MTLSVKLNSEQTSLEQKQRTLKLEQLRTAIRNQKRALRNELTDTEQQQAAINISHQLNLAIGSANTVALYLANDGEVSPNQAIRLFTQQARTILLPVMHALKPNQLNFQVFTESTDLVANKFNILEPKLSVADTYPLAQIDAIVMPLVAFDLTGNRLGMGGGFYDRTLSQIHCLTVRPLLIGLAHDCQQELSIPAQPWDMTLDIIVTPSKIININE